MVNKLNIAIGFVTGRSNVCNIINNYYKYILEQVKRNCYRANIVFYILFDPEYQGTPREDFYKIDEEVYKTEGIQIKYITPEDIVAKKVEAQELYKLSTDEIDLIFGNGHAKGRNSIMYFSYKDDMDYLLFWDDDEYPVACLKDENGKIEWKMQDNIVKHINAMEEKNADITIGYHCGYISPIPYMDFNSTEEEESIANYIDVIGNELVNWKSVKEKFEKTNGVTYAEVDISNGENEFELPLVNGKKFVAGSTLCINLKHIDKIPAFYNPPGARGEDTFFSIGMNDDVKVIKVPCYHFHDGFLEYREIMKNDFPTELKLIKSSENDAVKKRFFKACLGWIKYKPLYIYLLFRESYDKKMKKYKKQMHDCIKQINNYYSNYDFYKVENALNEYDSNVVNHYETYKKTNQVWDELKVKIRQ